MITAPSLRLLSLFGALALPLSAQTTTLLNDTFADLDRTNQALPTSSQWLTSASNSPANIDASSGALTTKNGQTTLTYFTGSGSPVNLAVGESLTVSFNVSLSGITNAAGNFRVGLYNSTGTRLSADAFGNSNAGFTGNYAGYLGVVNVGATSNSNFRVYERGTSAGVIGGSISDYALTGTAGTSFKTFIADNVYTGTLTLSRTDANTVSISQSYTGLFVGDSVASTTSATINDTAGINTSFDTLGFYYANTANLTFDNIKIDYAASAIPEPATTALLVGLAGLGLTVIHRRRKAFVAAHKNAANA